MDKVAKALDKGTSVESAAKFGELELLCQAYKEGHEQGLIDHVKGLTFSGWLKGRQIFQKEFGCNKTEAENLRKEWCGGKISSDDLPGRPISFKETPLWKEPVDGAALFEEIGDLIKTYVILDSKIIDAIVPWVAVAWLHEDPRLTCSAYLYVCSPVEECGKTTLCAAVRDLCPRPLAFGTDMSNSLLFRMIEDSSPTIHLDEVDNYYYKNNDLRALINASHRRDDAIVRVNVPVGSSWVGREFDTWGPKIMSGIGKLPRTTQSRCLVITMKRALQTEHHADWEERDKKQISEIASKLARWTMDNQNSFFEAMLSVPLPKGLVNRPKHLWKPFFSMAQIVGGDWPKRVLSSYELFSKNKIERSDYEKLLGDIKAIFKKADFPTHLSSARIVKDLVDMEERPWGAYMPNGKPLTQRKLANILTGFKVQTFDARQPDGKNLKSYKLEDLKPVWAAYLPIPSATPLQPAENLDLLENISATNTVSVADKKTPKPAENLACSGVADRNANSGGDSFEEEIAALGKP